MGDERPVELNRISGNVVAAAIAVHSALGPGLLEGAYEACLTHELTERGLEVQRQLELPVRYKGVKIDLGYRVDLLVEGSVIVELKAVREIQPIHRAQLLSYLRLSGKKVGLLINFNVERLVDGVHRLVNGL